MIDYSDKWLIDCLIDWYSSDDFSFHCRRYSCRLNRSDSDSCVPHQRPGNEENVNFARAALERRSLRWNRSANKNGRTVHAKHNHQPINMKTGLDLEVDLKASQVRLQNLNDEVSRLRSLAEKLVEVKNNADAELPEWFTELENDLGGVRSIKEEEVWRPYSIHGTMLVPLPEVFQLPLVSTLFQR